MTMAQGRALAAVALLAVSAHAWAGPADDLLARMPAQTPAQGEANSADLLALGPGALMDVAARLVPSETGGDEAVRYLLSGAAKYVSGPAAAEGERALFSGAVLAALPQADGPEVQTFLMSLLELAGGNEAVPALAGYLGDATLCEPAAQALVSIATPAAAQAVGGALAQATPETRLTLAKAAGELRYAGAVPALLEAARASDPALRAIALYALANIGAPRAADLLAEAVAETSGLAHAEAVTHHFLYARRRAEAGALEDARAIARGYLASDAPANVEAEALHLLVATRDPGALEALTQAVEQGSLDLAAAALRTANTLPGAAVTEALAGLVASAPHARARVLDTLTERGDPTAVPAIEPVLADGTVEEASAAAWALAALDPERAVHAVLARLESAAGDQALIDALAPVLLRLPGDTVVANAGAKLLDAPAPVQAALIEVLTAREARGSLGDLRQLAAGSDVAVQAAEALATLATPDDVPALIDTLVAAQDDAARAAIEAAIVAASEQVDDAHARVAPLLDAFEQADGAAGYYIHGALWAVAQLPARDPNNLAQGRPVTASVDPERDNTPGRAVDGNPDRDSAWWGESSPAALTIDLEAEHTIDKVHVTFYWDGERYYQYTIEVSKNGAEWVQVVDESATTEPAGRNGTLHTFAPQTARYVRLNVLHNSANEAVHVAEVMVYAERTEPARGLPDIPPAPLAPPDADGFSSLFNGRNLHGWFGDMEGYEARDGVLVCNEASGHLYTDREYSDFVMRFEFKLPPGGNNGLGVRVRPGDSASLDAVELQILDDTAEKHANIEPWQHHGSVYGIVPAKPGFAKPIGEWNTQEVRVKGSHYTVILNGETIVDADIVEAAKPQPADGKEHPGIHRTRGHLAWLGHRTLAEFRNIRIKPLENGE